MTDRPYMVIYPRGVRTLLGTAYVRDHEKDQWDLASKECFETREEAEGHARKLAAQNGLDLDSDIPKMLDDDALDGEMRLYSWPSSATDGYYQGRIIAMAPTADIARARIRKAHAENPKALEKGHLLDADLKEEPQVLRCGVAFVSGGS
jgi:hypothetical protein